MPSKVKKTTVKRAAPGRPKYLSAAPKYDDRLWMVRGLPEANHPPFVPGDRVLLRNLSHGPTGRISWWVIACECERCVGGEFVALDEILPEEYGGGQKHIRCAGLQRKGDINELNRDRAVDVLAMLGTGLKEQSVACGQVLAGLSHAWAQGTTHDGYIDPTTVYGAHRNELRGLVDTVLPYLSAPPATAASYHLGRMRRCESKTGILHNWTRYIAHSLGADKEAADAYAELISRHVEAAS